MQKRCNSCFEMYDDAFQVCPKCGYVTDAPGKEQYYLKPGTMLANRYIIGRGISQGGFGITYLAWDTKFDVKIAIKEYYWGGYVNRIPDKNDIIIVSQKNRKLFQRNFDRFIEEARNMAQFSSHKNIVNVFEYFEENNTAYIVMEYIDGCNLEKYFNDEKISRSVDMVLSISEKICVALKAIHKKGIIHRDIAPDNIMIEKDGNIKLIDFGAARFSSKEGIIEQDVMKPGYSPPEQYDRTRPQGIWSDIYALGALMYMMLTGNRPDDSISRKMMLDSNEKKDSIQPPHILNPEIPEYLSHVVMKAMAIERYLRFQSVTEMEKGLFQKKRVYSIDVERKRRRRKLMLTIAGGAVVTCGAAVFLGMHFFSRYITPAEITMWYVSDENSVLNTAKRSGLETMISDFVELYPQVQVNLVPVDAEEYTLQLSQALQSANAPDLFESAVQDETLYGSCEELTWITENAIDEGCSFLEQYEVCYPDGKKFPIGFQIPLLYVNQSLSGTYHVLLQPEIAAVSSDELTVRDARDEQIYTYQNPEFFVQKGYEDVFAGLFPGIAYQIAENDAVFLTRECAFYFGTSESYLPMISALPGQAIALEIPSELAQNKIPCAFDYEWSLYDNGSSEKKAASRLLSFMLSESAQETMMVMNQCQAMPLQRTVQESYSMVYEGVFSDIAEESSYYIFETRE